jgi:hypothetical protein
MNTRNDVSQINQIDRRQIHRTPLDMMGLIQ